jgi:hypothetical protein
MATHTTEHAHEMPRRVVLIDFDWQDADLLPELLKRPGVSVRLVAGSAFTTPESGWPSCAAFRARSTWPT